MTIPINKKILVIDDSSAIHDDFRKILVKDSPSSSLQQAKTAFLGAGIATGESVVEPSFEMHSAHQGTEGLELLKAARAAGEPFSVAFVDVRMPPGWDGVETIQHLWAEDSDLQVVMCTAYSDYSWNETISKLGTSDRLLILKKPFDPVEICQLASALTKKWTMHQREQELIRDLTRKEQEARAYSSSLETVNRALESNQAIAERSRQLKNEFFVRLSSALHASTESILQDALRASNCAGDDLVGAVETLLGTARRFLSSIDELGTLAELDAGQYKLHPEGISPREIAQQSLAKAQPLADAKGIELRLELTEDAPDFAVLDKDCLLQTIEQLLCNAIENTDEGSVALRVGSHPTSNWKEQLLLFEVEDTGTGIESQEHKAIFDAFYKSAESEGTSGSAGLGLTVVKRLVRQMSAELEFESSPGQGSCFRLKIPVETALRA